MGPSDWVPPKPEVRLEGTITYRCSGCGDLIDGAHVLWPLEDGRVMSITRAYHHDHLPQPHDTREVKPNGR
jgi:hypothetical protein